MKTIDKRSIASKLPSLGTATATEDLYQNDKGRQVRAFTKGQPYKVTRASESHLVLVSNAGEEHFVLAGGWMDKFDIKLAKPLPEVCMHVSADEFHVSVSIKHSALDLSVASADNLGDAWHVSRVMVREKHRGKSYGSKMLRRMLDEIEKFGPATVVVFPGGYNSDPEAQRNFYTKNGFVPGDKPGMLTYSTKK